MCFIMRYDIGRHYDVRHAALAAEQLNIGRVGNVVVAPVALRAVLLALALAALTPRMLRACVRRLAYVKDALRCALRWMNVK